MAAYLSLLLVALVSVRGEDFALTGGNSLALPAAGSGELRILSPTVLELGLITTKDADPARPSIWNFVGDNFQPLVPALAQFSIQVNGLPAVATKAGFKRRPLYAPVKQRDLRIANWLYLELLLPIPEGAQVRVLNPSGLLWGGAAQFAAQFTPQRFSPALHVNQVGYIPDLSKKAMVGYYLGTLGEMKIPSSSFRLINAANGQEAYSGSLTRRRDSGYTYSPAPYQEVFEADFTAFQTPGEYRLMVPGLGVSFPFRIDDGAAAAFTRNYALGLYHQRCGMPNGLPCTRFTHDACHTATAEVPTAAFNFTASVLKEVSDAKEARQTARQLQTVNASLYPFQRQSRVDVSGGHHDAGDYSKYTINSAGLIHYLVFAADAFPGAGELDNLGLPESGNGKSDLLEEAKWEADFLAKMQDDDGGFYFLVYPKERRYEDTVLPENGDPQVVWPKTTAVTAAAVAALAEAGSSPRFKAQFPQASALYLEKARKGWTFLTNAIALHGKEGSYQKLTHYGNEFIHDDELAWAAAAMFAATGEASYHAKLMEWFGNPADPNTRRWNWWRMFEGYGCAIRTYAFAARSGRLAASKLNAAYLLKCENEMVATANDQLRFARESAYGTSFPDLNKQYRSAGWYFSSERAFDLTAGYQISARPEYLEALVSNLNYEHGCNPVNISYVTGLGAQRQREIVHQYAQNDHRVLPPSGIPLGNVQAGFAYLYHYKQELGALSFPADGAATATYPYYDRWADSFNTTTEFVVVDQARSLASLSFLMARSSLKNQAWKPSSAQITGLPAQIAAEREVTAQLVAPGLDLTEATIVWEARDQEPHFGRSFTFSPKLPGEQWVEAEAQLPDGRRVFATARFIATTAESVPPNRHQSAPVAASGDVVALYHLDSGLADATGRQGNLSIIGSAALDASNVGWMAQRSGSAMRFKGLDDRATVEIPASALAVTPSTVSISIEAMIYVNAFKAYNQANAKILSLYENWNSYLELVEDPYAGIRVKGGTQLEATGQDLVHALSLNQWHHLSISIDRSGYTVKIDGEVIKTAPASELSNWGGGGPATLQIGKLDGWIDEVVVRRKETGGASESAPKVNSIQPMTGGSVRLLVSGQKTGATYLIQSSGNLRDWQNIGTNSLSVPAVQVSDPHASETGARFYRLVQLN